MQKHYRAENDCLNCGAILQGKFCHVCGQENLQLKESFGHVMNHAISDYFHFDEQFFNTLKPLLFKPGKLTNEYMAGKRVSYLHPVKMYIFISFVYFVLLFGGNTQQKHAMGASLTKEHPTKADSIVAKNPNLTKEEKETIYANYDYIITKNKDGSNDTAYQSLQGLTKLTKDTTYAQYLAGQSKLPTNKRDGLLRRFLVKKILGLKKSGVVGNDLLLETFEHNVPKAMFLLLPIFALILMVTFWKNKKFYIEHLIYSFHFHCFIFLLLTLFMLIEMVIPTNWDFINIIAFVWIIWYAYRSLRVVYDRSWWRTITKMIGIAVSYMAALIICMCILFLIVAVIAV